jgi:ABC-type antimicrobial peptide transport system permease subunit
VLLTVFAGLALTLASIGIYGVMSYIVTQRTRELGIRMALGAARGSVLRRVLIQGMQLATLGVGIGVLGAFVVTRSLASQLYDVKAKDPSTYLIVVAALMGIGFVATLLPAVRATKVDPVEALRGE